MHKTFLFSYNFPFFIWFIPLVYIIGIKPAPGEHESIFKKMGEILCGCNTKWTGFFTLGYLFIYFAPKNKYKGVYKSNCMEQKKIFFPSDFFNLGDKKMHLDEKNNNTGWLIMIYHWTYKLVWNKFIYK